MILDILPVVAEPPVMFIPAPSPQCDELDDFLTFAVRELGATVTRVPASDIPLSPAQVPRTFNEWLETSEGQDVVHRILNNRHGANMDAVAAYFDTAEDVQQKALIWLWRGWDKDPGYNRFGKDVTSSSHRAAILTKVAIRGARCMYAKRRVEQREAQVDLHNEDGLQRRFRFPLVNVRATDVEEHDRCVYGKDKHLDVQNAIEVVVQRTIDYFNALHRKKDGTLSKRVRHISIEHIARTIIEGHMYHYTHCAGNNSLHMISCYNSDIFDLFGSIPRIGFCLKTTDWAKHLLIRYLVAPVFK